MIRNLLLSLFVLLTVLSTGTVFAGVQKAASAYEKQDYAAALKEVRPLAEKGDALAQTILGLMYYNGRGVPQDYAQGVAWFRKAAAQGNSVAQDELGRAYRFGRSVPQDYAEAASWFRKAAEQGHAEAEFSLGLAYEKGRGVPQDYEQALTWYLKAAVQGKPEAQNNLANLYQKGEGTPKDDAQALLWYRKSAEQGYATAQAVLGFMYGTGSGVSKDAVQAVEWYRKAAAQGNTTAQSNLRLVESQLDPAQRETIEKKGIQEIEARGYKFLTFTDFELDAKSMPLGKKIAVTGLYQVQGQMETLAERLSPDALSVLLITEDASRPTRKQFIECRRIGMYCTLTLLGHTTECNVTWLGHYVSTKVCLSVETDWDTANSR
jgi:TPR repeat protein